MMLQEFGGRMPETALLLPLFMMGRVVGILYIDGDSSEIRARIGDLQRLIAKAIMAFEILILKKKILTL
jgi:sugar diacid utilization regulator